MIYITKNNQREGPHSEEEVRRKLSIGELTLTDFGWREGLPKWIILGELLGIKMPPPLPITTAGGPPPLPGGGKHSLVNPSAATSGCAMFLIFFASGFGILGSYFDIALARAIEAKIQSGYSDFDSFINSLSGFWQGVMALASFFIPDSWKTEGEQLLHALRSAANILITCGIIGGLAAILFWLRRYLKILAVIMIVTGIAPLMFDTQPFGFAGLPMALGGFIGLFVRSKK